MEIKPLASPATPGDARYLAMLDALNNGAGEVDEVVRETRYAFWLNYFNVLGDSKPDVFVARGSAGACMGYLSITAEDGGSTGQVDIVIPDRYHECGVAEVLAHKAGIPLTLLSQSTSS